MSRQVGDRLTDAGGEPSPASMRPFWLLWSGQALSLLGSQAVQFALIWWLTDLTRSAAVLALASLVGLLPPVLFGPFIGVLVDRWDRRRVMLAADSASAAASAVLALLFAAGRAGVPAVMAILTVRAFAAAFHGPALLASTSLMVPERELVRIQGLQQSVHGLAAILSPPLGALLIATLSMEWVVGVDVMTALPAVVSLLLVAVPRPDSSAHPGGVRGVLVSMREGLVYLRARRAWMLLLVLAAVVNLCLVPAFSLLPLLVRGELGLGAGQLGWIEMGFGVGTILGGIGLGLLTAVRPKLLPALGGMLILSGGTIALGFAPAGSLLLPLLAAAAVGAAAALVNGPIHAIFQATVRPEFQGRVLTLVGSVAGLATPLGLFLAAPVAEALGVRAWYFIGGGIALIVAAGAVFSPALRRVGEAEGRPVPTGNGPPCGADQGQVVVSCETKQTVVDTGRSVPAPDSP